MRKLSALFLLLVLIPPLAQAKGDNPKQLFNKHVLKTEKLQNDQKIYFDLNKDGRADQIDHYHNKELINRKEDLNFDGKFDKETKIFSKPKPGLPYKIIEIDEDFNGKVDRRQSYIKRPEINKTKIEIQVDKDNDGKFELSYLQHVELSEESESCAVMLDTVEDTLRNLSESVFSITSELGQKWHSSDYGLKIHNDCVQKWGPVFLDNAKKAIEEGFQCLSVLAKNQSKKDPPVTGVLRNAVNLSSLYEKESIKLVCNEKDDDRWSRATAHASASRGEVLAHYGIKYPFISLNPRYQNDYNDKESALKAVRSTLFHEQFHLLGIKHNESIEYPYACADCCGSDKDNLQKKLACQICTGDYKNERDPEYLKQVTEWGNLSYTSKHSLGPVTRYLKENKNSQLGIVLLAASNATYFNPVGAALAEVITQNLNPKDKEANKFIDIALKNKKSAQGMGLDSHAKILAESLYSLYYNQDPDSALKKLEDNVEILKVFKNVTNKNDNNYFLTNMQNVLRNILNEIWLDDYKGAESDEEKKKKFSDRAYELHKKLMTD